MSARTYYLKDDIYNSAIFEDLTITTANTLAIPTKAGYKCATVVLRSDLTLNSYGVNYFNAFYNGNGGMTLSGKGGVVGNVFRAVYLPE